eukprot:10309319-Karenia_brevis.AAC.1
MFRMRVDHLIPQYRDEYGEYIAEDLENRIGEPLKFWARERFGEMDPTRFVNEYELKRHVYALGKLAGMNAQQ